MKLKILLCGVLIAGGCLPAWCGFKVRLKLVSVPTGAEPGQQFQLCAANVGSGNIGITLQLVNVRNGAVMLDKTVDLPPVGSGKSSSDPCLTSTVPPGEQALVVGVVLVKHGPLFRQIGVTSTLQVRATAADGSIKTIQSASLRPVEARQADTTFIPTP